jgi:4-amino-4-deoxy-L-arabinose transferase-like glycosyltransferase
VRAEINFKFLGQFSMQKILQQIKQYWEPLLLVLILVVAFSLRMFFLHEPFERDEGWYGTIAQEILHGGIPYRDAIDQKPPGVFYLYAVGMAFFGHTTESIRIFTALYSSLTLLAVYWLARNLAGPVAGLCAGAVCAFVASAPLLQASSSNSEVFMVLPLMLSACAFVSGYRSKSLLLLAISGFCVGLAMLIKTVALPYLLLLVICALLFNRSAGYKGAVKNLVVFIIPPILLALFTMLYFYANGALADFMYWNVTVPLKYSQGKSGVSGPQLPLVLNYLKGELIFPALLSLPAAIWLLLFKRNFPGVLVALLLPVSCLAVLLPGMNFPHYFIQLVPFMSVLAGISLALVIEGKRLIFWSAFPLIVIMFAFYLNSDYKFYLKMTPEELSFVKYGRSFVESEYIARYIRDHTNQDDYIFQWGFEPELYFLSQRRTPVPYISSTILANMENPALSAQTMVATLMAKNPKYIIIQPEWANWPGYVELWQLMVLNYELETVVGYAQIYRRR